MTVKRMDVWKKIKREYVGGSESYRQIAGRYGMSRYSVAERGKSGEWPRLRREKKAAEAGKTGADDISGTAEAEKASAAGNEGEEAAGLYAAAGEKNEERIRLIAEKLLEKISDGIASGEISVSGANIRQLTATVKDIMDILGVMTSAEAEEHCARIEKMKRETECDRTVSVVFGDAFEFSE